jgi:4-methyl-5(b-hydroxyethyl)-thiazole monophosphate biosynthesis
MKTALVILAECFEEIEAVAVIDILRRAEIDCTIAAQHDSKFVTGKTGIQIIADEIFTDALAEQGFDLVVLPGGPGVRHLRKDPKVLKLARTQAASKGYLAAICAAPMVLHDAGLLSGRRYTAHPSVGSELKAVLDEPVVRDGNIITSRGPGTAVDFGLALVESLCGKEKAAEIRSDICAI